MRFPSIVFYALSISLATVLLAGCSANPGIATPATPGSGPTTHSVTDRKKFVYTGKPQVFQVPANVHSITVDMLGASSARASCFHSSEGYRGNGGRVFAVIPVMPHQKLWVYVGGPGNGSSGGFNGGGKSGGTYANSGGAGASDVRVAPGRRSDRILVAGGAGGDGGEFCDYSYCDNGCPGYGGGLAGGDGIAGIDYYGGGGGGGGGGSQSAGGTGGHGGAPNSSHHGNAGENGRLGIGGAGGQAVSNGSFPTGGGGGGGGYYGGGGGGGGIDESSSDNGSGGGGGGGSGFAERKATQVRFWSNWKNATGNGVVVFTW